MAISASDVKALRDQTGAGMMDCKNALKEAAGDLSRAIEVLRERGLAKAGKRAGRETTEGSIGISVSGAAAGIIEVGCETDFVAKTDEFQSLARSIADLVAGDAALGSLEAVLAAPLGYASVEATITNAVAKLGENIALKRVERVAVETGVAGGYVHAGGKLGVIIALGTSASGSVIEALAKDLSMHIAAVDPTPVAIDRDAMPVELVEAERRILRGQALATGKPENVVEKIVEGRLAKFYAEQCLLEQAFVRDPDQAIAGLLEKVASEVGDKISVVAFARYKLGEANAE